MRDAVLPLKSRAVTAVLFIVVGLGLASCGGGGGSGTDDVADKLTLPAVSDRTYTANVAIADLTLPTAAGGTSPYTYTLHPAAGEVSPNANGTLTPVPGLTFDPATRTLTGDPTTAGTYPLLYTATDTAATAAAQSFTLTVAAGQPPPPDGGGSGVTPDPPAQPVSCPSATSTDSADTVYRLTFQSRWTPTNFPTNFPPGAHFSQLVGAVHDAGNGFWDRTRMASRGIENMAEEGRTGRLVSEINEASPTTAYVGSGIGSNNIGGSTTLEFRVNPDCPVVTFVSMLAPSHDWFVGVGGSGGFDLRNAEGSLSIKRHICCSTTPAPKKATISASAVPRILTRRNRLVG